MKFSILIPSWNNLAYLKLCIASIQQYSAFPHEILVHVNEGSDGSLAWVQSENIIHTHSEKNIGICMSLNQLAALATGEWIVFLNDDMFCCPDWDIALLEVIQKANTDLLFLSSTVIEPKDTGNDKVIIRDCGSTPESFDEKKLLAIYQEAPRADLLGKAYQPTIVSRRVWHMVGGYSIEFSPGMASDDDFLVKLWLVGCRDFRVVNASRVYHFGCRSTGRVRKNNGSRQFNFKWGITVGDFNRCYIARYAEPLSLKPTWMGRFRRFLYAFTKTPLGDIHDWQADQ